MKIILSRKGFDTDNGGVPGPIISRPNAGSNSLVFVPPKSPAYNYTPAGDPVFFPIPREADPLTYDQITIKSVPLTPAVTQLSSINPGAGVPAWFGAHLDPDLDSNSISRLPNWRPTLGSTQGHLKNVNSGDLFLFFGLFQEAQAQQTPFRTQWIYVPNSEPLNILFGWLQIETVFQRVGRKPVDPSAVLSQYPWLFQHPHLKQKYWDDLDNLLFTASATLSLPFAEQSPLSGIPGGGHFSGLQSRSGSSYILTDLTQPKPSWKRSRWLLPNWNINSNSPPNTTAFLKGGTWTPNGSDWVVQLRGQGQESIIDLSAQPPGQAAVIENWIFGLFT
jgi:hypothetical protein